MRRRRSWAYGLGFGFAALALLLLTASASALLAQSTEETPTEQVFGMATTPAVIPAPVMQDYLDAFALTHGVGINGNAFTEKWSTFEATQGNIQVGDFIDGMNSYEDFYPDTAAARHSGFEHDRQRNARLI